MKLHASDRTIGLFVSIFLRLLFLVRVTKVRAPNKISEMKTKRETVLFASMLFSGDSPPRRRQPRAFSIL